MSETISIEAIELNKRQGIVTVSVKIDGKWFAVLAAGLYGSFVSEIGAEAILNALADAED